VLCKELVEVAEINRPAVKNPRMELKGFNGPGEILVRPGVSYDEGGPDFVNYRIMCNEFFEKFYSDLGKEISINMFSLSLRSFRSF
jgi:hypothetical protein